MHASGSWRVRAGERRQGIAEPSWDREAEEQIYKRERKNGQKHWKARWLLKHGAIRRENEEITPPYWGSEAKMEKES